MEYIREVLETPIRGDYDIVVVGAGPAGCGAALSAARNGASVALIDRFNCPGGMWTTGFMNPLFDGENKSGIMRELIDGLKAENEWGGFWNISFNYETMKSLLEQKLQAAGVHLYYQTTFCKTLTEGRRVTGVVCENIDGRFALTGRYVFDCTGDGNAAASAGCAFEIGVDGDYRECQGMTLMFLVANIPEKYQDGLMLGKILDKAYEAVGKEAPFHVPFLIPAPHGRFGVIQFTHMYEHDPLSEQAKTEATIEGRRQMQEAIRLLRQYDPDFAEMEIILSSNILGVRESRRIIGDYTVSYQDATEGSQFEDGICPVSFGIDIHPKKGQAQDCRPTKCFQIPFRALLPKGWDGIVVAGRCISGSHEAMAAYRVTGNCCAMGDAAGKIAAYCLQNGIDIRQADVRSILGE